MELDLYFLLIFWVTLPCALQLLNWATTNGGSLKQKCVSILSFFFRCKRESPLLIVVILFWWKHYRSGNKSFFEFLWWLNARYFVDCIYAPCLLNKTVKKEQLDQIENSPHYSGLSIYCTFHMFSPQSLAPNI